MPFESAQDVRERIKGAEDLSDRKARQWMHIFNDCYDEHGDDDKCYAMAWGAVNKTSSLKKAFLRNKPQCPAHLAMLDRLEMFDNEMQLSRFRGFDSVSDISFDFFDNGEASMDAKFYSDNHVYTITVHQHFGKPIEQWYMGCVSQNRYWNPTEDWHRGSDLPDGEFVFSKWSDIISSIAASEIKEISEYFNQDKMEKTSSMNLAKELTQEDNFITFVWDWSLSSVLSRPLIWSSFEDKVNKLYNKALQDLNSLDISTSDMDVYIDEHLVSVEAIYKAESESEADEIAYKAEYSLDFDR